MPLFKGCGCKSTPEKAIAYITNSAKAAIVSSLFLDDSRSYAKQFRETAAIFEKGKKFDERKYYHFKLSCARSDNVSPESHHNYAEELAKKLFPNSECVIATHIDTDTVHSHIIVNAVNFVDGKKLDIRNKLYGGMKDTANNIGIKRGFKPLDFRKHAKDRIHSKERHTMLKGGTSWKEELREVIAEAKMNATSMTEFIKYLKNYGVTITRNTDKTISFLHPLKSKAIRGDKLGWDYTKGAIVSELNKSTNRMHSDAKRKIEHAREQLQVVRTERSYAGTTKGHSGTEPDDTRAVLEKFDTTIAKSRTDIEADDRARADRNADGQSSQCERNREDEPRTIERER